MIVSVKCAGATKTGTAFLIAYFLLCSGGWLLHYSRYENGSLKNKNH